MKDADRNSLRAEPLPWMAYLLGLAGGGLALGASEPVMRALGICFILGGALWLLSHSRKTKALIDRILQAIPLQDKSEALFRELPRAWAGLEQENQGLRQQIQQEDQTRTTILANLSVGIVLFNADRTIELFNPAAQAILGTSSHLAQGADAMAVFREPESHRFLEKAFEGITNEWELRRDPKLIRCRATSISNSSFVFVTIEDITRQEALETTRQKFISNASHELKTPTASIRIAAENLLDGAQVTPEGIPNVQSILRSTDRMTMLLRDISELSRIETGAFEFHPEEIRLAEFVETFLEDLRPQAKARRIRLRTHLPEDLQGFRFKADPHRLGQILENLLSNAIKFSPEDSEVLLTVSREGQWISWSVVDQGPGIAPSEAQRIFERFYRSPQTRGVPGTGLGLSIVKHLSALMGAEIALKSDLGQGATFTLHLPLTETTF